ncbi:hypothetical protein MKEN_00574700 [Mycena kentingensis (nom. inval.)]|nr:hypothetical protein MKEN_00574700 [Mycena kentingensis (nom. inval.)]
MNPNNDQLQLLDLNHDVLLHILSWCTIRSVLRASETCTTLHSLSRSKALWIALLRDLRNRGLLDASTLYECTLGSGAGALSTPDLVDEVKALLTRRAGASREARLPGPLPHPAMMVQQGYSDISVVGGEEDGGMCPSMGPGRGRGAADGRLVWRRDSSDDGLVHWHNCPTFATDVLYGGETARLLLFEEDISRSSIEVHEIDLLRGLTHTKPFTLDLPNCNLNSPSILGTFGVGVLWSPYETDGYWCSWLLFDWAAQSGLVLSWEQVCHIALVPGYLLVLVAVTPCERYELRVLSMDELRRNHLLPLAPAPSTSSSSSASEGKSIAQWPRTRITSIPPSSTHVIRGPATTRQPYEFSMGDLSAHADPREAGVYQVRFEFFAHAVNEEEGGGRCSI